MEIDKIKLKNFLLFTEEFYKPENPKNKDGIGHEIEHIKGVCQRSMEIYDTLKQHKYIDDTIKPEIVLTVAALHDIGNAIDRKNHNFLGNGILNGYLTVEGIIDSASNIPERIKNDLKAKIDAIERNDKKVYELYRAKDIYKMYSAVIKFEMAYNGKNGKSYEKNEISQLVNKITNNIALRKKLTKDIESSFDSGKQIKYNKDLKIITEKFNECFGDNMKAKQTVISAVTEHNMDFIEAGRGKRFVSSSIYGNIIADADKDNIPEVFAIRTMAFAKNFFLRGKKLDPKEEKDYCVGHVLHQCRERFGFSRAEYKNLTGKDEPQPVFPEILNYKNQEDIKCYDKKGRIRETRGDDIFYQVDEYLKNIGKQELFSCLADVGDGKSKSSGLKRMRQWSLIENEIASRKEVGRIYDVFKAAQTIEDAVAVYERQVYEKGKNEYSFSDIINGVLMPEKINEIPKKDISLKEDKEFTVSFVMENPFKQNREDVFEFSWEENKDENNKEKVFVKTGKGKNLGEER